MKQNQNRFLPRQGSAGLAAIYIGLRLKNLLTQPELRPCQAGRHNASTPHASAESRSQERLPDQCHWRFEQRLLVGYWHPH